jgi:hypothetical protein
MVFVDMECRSCFTALHDPDRCGHKDRYRDLESFVVTRSITIEHPDREDFAHKPSDAFTLNYNRYIRMSSIGYRIYGWDVMTSCLVHELGHCELFLEGIGEPKEWDKKIEVENLANEKGASVTPPSLVPENYWRHRRFFLRPYLERGWTREKVLSEWKLAKDLLSS